MGGIFCYQKLGYEVAYLLDKIYNNRFIGKFLNFLFSGSKREKRPKIKTAGEPDYRVYRVNNIEVNNMPTWDFYLFF